MRLLVLNAGSSSLKFEVCDVDAGDGRAVRVDPTDAQVVPRLVGTYADFGPGGCSLEWRRAGGDRAGSGAAAGAAGRRRAGATSVGDAAAHLVAWLHGPGSPLPGVLDGLDGCAHRIVHGGERFVGPTLLDEPAIDALEALGELAPLHNPPAMAALQEMRCALGAALPHVGVFDTAYYAQLPEAAKCYAVPPEWRERHGVQRYGFHGIAHRWMGRRAAARLGRPVDELRIVSLQLGRGCSVTATRHGRAIDTSMGFTPLEGLVMGTRSGDVDAGAVLHVMARTGASPAEMSATLNGRSGLAALSGRSGDMRELVELAARGDPRATLAVDAFCRRARHYVGAYLAELGGADAIVFGGGIGEHSAPVRERILAPLAGLGIQLDAQANARAGADEARIDDATGGTSVHVIPVQESRLIAADAAGALARAAAESAAVRRAARSRTGAARR